MSPGKENKETSGKNKPWNLDCRHFLGDRPCRFKRTCPDCPQYDPMGTRILLIKLAAIGDVLRTTPLLSGLKRKYPQSHITWVVSKEAAPLLKNNLLIDRLIPFDFVSLLPLAEEVFDMVIGLEKEPPGAALTSRVKAPVKKGFGLSVEGNVYPLNSASEYSFLLGLADDLKFRKNQKTYPELIFEAAELAYQKDEYLLALPAADLAFAEKFRLRNHLPADIPIIGLNTGAGDVFANKAWNIKGYIHLIERLHEEKKGTILLLGGPQEKERNHKIMEAVKGKAIDSGCENTLEQFAALLNLCHLVVTGDTTALHVAVGLKKKVVALFGPTSAQEIELYGRGEKIVSPLPCGPCYRRSCQIVPNCMEAISAEEVIQKIQILLPDEHKAGGI